MSFLLAYTTAMGEGGPRQHGAHAHGRGVHNIVIDGQELAVELEVPAVNVVGFEHRPKNGRQRRAVENALVVFGRAETLFVPSAASRCRAEATEVTLAGLEHSPDSGHEDHGPSGGHEEKHDETHSELRAEYRFHCDVPDALEAVEVRVFQHLRDMDEIDIQLVSPTLQAAVDSIRTRRL